jgi:hypothetical protein
MEHPCVLQLLIRVTGNKVRVWQWGKPSNLLEPGMRSVVGTTTGSGGTQEMKSRSCHYL